MCVANFMTIYATAVETFHWININFDMLVAHEEKSDNHQVSMLTPYNHGMAKHAPVLQKELN